MGAATHMICVGATKAGTSWLYNYLSRHPECSLRTIKELHYFDTVDSGSYERQIRLKRAELARVEAEDPGPNPQRHARRCRDLRAWLAVIERRREDVPAYLAYLDDRRGKRRVVGDVTPAYSLLPEAGLRRIATMAGDVRIVYLLRDPVSRLWSHVRMLARRQARDPADFARTARVLMERALAGEEESALVRGDYASALARLDAAVAPERLLVMLQDDLLSPDGAARLTEFLGIAPREADFGRRAHEGLPLDFDPGHRARAAEMLRPQYDCVARRFGGLPEGWQRTLAAARA